MNIMNDEIVGALEISVAEEEPEIWNIHNEHLDTVYANGGTSQVKKAPIYPRLLNWAIAFHAHIWVNVYEEVR